MNVVVENKVMTVVFWPTIKKHTNTTDVIDQIIFNGYVTNMITKAMEPISSSVMDAISPDSYILGVK
jgi:fatty acid/phospholipid biosynthesis enzyme